VILSEPPQTQYDLRFRLLGIPVRVHPLFWLVALLLGLRGNQEAGPMAIWIGAVFVSILVHELGHALAARSYGWQPWITLHGFGGLASYQPTYRSPVAQVLITLAGPGAGFLFAALVIGLIAASGHRLALGWPEFMLPVIFEPYKSHTMNLLAVDLLYVNIFWGLVNLLPVYPLDGGQIAQEVFQAINPRDGLRQSLWLSVIVAALAGVLAYARLGELFLAIFFVYMAYASYMTLQAYFGPGGGLGGFR
jgi:membrane-associated protease RseP (regulator of RpoE activity)